MTVTDAEHLCRRAVENFWEYYENVGCSPTDPVRLLTRLACHEDPEVAKHGIAALFGEIVEPLNDGFREHYCHAYDRMFTEVIQHARRYSACELLDHMLRRRGLSRARDLFRRKQRLLEDPLDLSIDERAGVQKVVVLSRVTIGADIAITSVVIDIADRLFPGARVVYMAPPANRHITAGHANVVHRSVSYRRQGHLPERLNAWLEVRDAVEQEIDGLAGEEYVILDTDSRLTQLGLLPLGENDRYFFFPSRRYGGDGRRSLGVLTSRWMQHCFDVRLTARPHIWLGDDEREWAFVLDRHLRDTSERPIVSVSFGVGGDERKRLGETFEVRLLQEFVCRGYRVFMTRGVGEEEVERSYRTTSSAAGSGLEVAHLRKGRIAAGLRGTDWDIATWEADLGAFFSAIACSDLYVGYDSAGQHAAAALGVPTITVFCAASGRRHMQRWTPHGSAPVERVAIEADEPEVDDLLDQTMRTVDKLQPAAADTAALDARILERTLTMRDPE